MKIPNLFAVTLLTMIFSGCATAPSKPPEEVRQGLIQSLREGGLEAGKVYYEENLHFVAGNAFPEGKGKKVLIVGDGYDVGGNTSGYLQWGDIARKFNSDQRTINQINTVCDSEKESDLRECLAMSDSNLEALWLSKAAIVQARSVFDSGLAKLKKMDGEKANQQNALALKIEEANKQKAIAWLKLCRDKKISLVRAVTVIPINRFQNTSFWAKTMGLNPTAVYWCPHAKKAEKVVYAACLNDRRSSCAVVDGLPSNVQANTAYQEFLHYAGTAKGQTEMGFDQDKLPIWKVIPKDALKKYGIENQ